MSTKSLLTADELEQMPDVDSVQRELDEGELIEMPPAGVRHGRCAIRIMRILDVFVEKNKLGSIHPGDTGFRLQDDIVRAPDVAFVRAERSVDVPGFFPGSPDLAVEIFSPSDRVRQLMRKVKQYFAAGTHTVWIVYPDLKQVQILDAAGADRLLKNGDLLEAPDLLPGFSVPISEFFD